MALPILDGNQSATTLSTILSSGQHITAHTVVSLGTQAITDMRSAVSGSVVSVSNFPSSQVISGTVTANVPLVSTDLAGGVTQGIPVYLAGGKDGVVLDEINYVNNVVSLPPISGTVTANAGNGYETVIQNGIANFVGEYDALPISGTVTANLGTFTISSGEPLARETGDPALSAGVGIGFGKGVNFQAVDDNPENSFPVKVQNSVTIGSLPAISGTVTANTFALQGTAVTTSDFTSTTASTVLASFNATREVLTIFNEGAGNLFVSVGATCTTIAYQVRLSAGDYYEVPNHQTTITHSAVFATAGTARVCQVS
jgi:hypothetical protein